MEGITIVIKEGDEVFLQLTRNDVFIQFLCKNITGVLIHLYDTVDLTIDILPKHFLDSHDSNLLQTMLNAL